MSNFKQGDIITYDIPTVIKGNGRIVGVAITEQAIIGHTFIIEDMSGSVPTEKYPYTHFAAAEIFLKPHIEPIDKNKVLYDMCLGYRHDFDLLPEEKRMEICKEMEKAYKKTFIEHFSTNWNEE